MTRIIADFLLESLAALGGFATDGVNYRRFFIRKTRFDRRFVIEGSNFHGLEDLRYTLRSVKSTNPYHP